MEERVPAERFVALEAADDVARAVVDSGVAHSCAAGWARFDGAQWVTGVGGAFRPGEGAPLVVESAADVVFDLASVTKSMFAVAVAQSGVDPRTPLVELLPEVRGTAAAHTSIETLLAHRSGLEANLPLFQHLRAGDSSRAALVALAANAKRAECAAPLPPDGHPPLYSDLGYVLAGEAVARARAVRDAGDLVAQSLVAPLANLRELGTARELLAAGVDVASRAAPTERVDWRGGVVRGRVHDENAWMLTGLGGSGHAGMFGSVRGVLAFARYVYERLPALDWTVRPRAGGTLRAGFDGKSTEASSAGQRMGARAFGHLGFTGTSFWIDPDAGVVVVLLTNRVYPTRESALIRSARPLAHDALFDMAARAKA